MRWRAVAALLCLCFADSIPLASVVEPLTVEALKRVVKGRLEGRFGDAVLDAAGVPSTGAISNTLGDKFSRVWQAIFGTNSAGGESIYDCVIDMGSLRRLASEGWPLALKSEDAVDRLFTASSTALIVSMVGAYNQGKTHVVNKLLHSNYESGLLQHTRGLSMTLPKSDGNNWLIIDSAGSNQPVHSNGGEEPKDKLMSERFLEELMLTLSDALIVVVNALTFSDQTFLEELHMKITRYQNREMKRVFVLHNFKELTNSTDVEARIREDLKLGLGCIPKSAKVGDTVVPFWRDTRFWNHLVLARDDSPAGREFNSGSIRLLEAWLQGAYADKSGFETTSLDPRKPKYHTLGAKILTTCQRWLPRYFDLPNATVQQLQEALHLELSVGADDNPMMHLKSKAGGLRFREQENQNGAIIGESGSFAPRYDLLHASGRSTLLMDLPGVAFKPRKTVKRPNHFRTRIEFFDEENDSRTPAVIVINVHHAPEGHYRQARLQLWARRSEPSDVVDVLGERQRHFGTYSHEAILLPVDVRLEHADASLDSSGVLRVDLQHVQLEPETDTAESFENFGGEL
eukprot:TRINITY_DN64943_c0_g1_i1.p1 TRINITY_DN64943_c0_g1~~TRINITY_DN64943_c0_g1_i1.p1  ORF type:complete len:583 (+),score=70.81 TRINITY_DN64943_c0_g1_i1:36-1751(+)